MLSAGFVFIIAQKFFKRYTKKHMDAWLKIGKADNLKNPEERRLYRFFEVLPGGLAWFTIAGIFFASWRFPIFASFFIIAFDLYWLLKTIPIASPKSRLQRNAA